MASGVGTGRDSDKYMLRFEDDLRPRMKQLAQQNDRTLNAEINVAMKFYLTHCHGAEIANISEASIELLAEKLAKKLKS